MTIYQFLQEIKLHERKVYPRKITRQYVHRVAKKLGIRIMMRKKRVGVGWNVYRYE